MDSGSVRVEGSGKEVDMVIVVWEVKGEQIGEARECAPWEGFAGGAEAPC